MMADAVAAMQVSWHASWDHPAKAFDKTGALVLIYACQARRADMLRALRNIAGAQSLHAARRMSRRYMFSFSSKLAVLARSYSRKIMTLKDAPEAQLVGLVDLAAQVTAWQDPGEKAIAYQKPKKSHGHRWVHKHGVLLYALELLVTDAAKALGDPLPNQFIMKGGLHKFDAWLAGKLPSTKLVITVDIPSCFDLMNRRSVEDALPLPKQVVDEILFAPMDRAVHHQLSPKGYVPMDTGTIVVASSAKRGIAQGSALAQVASEAVLALVIMAIKGAGSAIEVASHGDNRIILLGDEADKQPVVSSLTHAVAKHFGAGVLDELARRIRSDKPQKGFWFCRRFYRFRKGKLTKDLPAGWVDEFGAKTVVRIQDAMAVKDTEAFDTIECSIQGWFAQNPTNKAVQKETLDLLAHLKMMRN